MTTVFDAQDDRQPEAENDSELVLGRWVEPALTDPAAFFAAHPETVVGPELWDILEPEIKRQANHLEWDEERRTDVAAEIRLRIIEAATGSRERDEQGRPIYDYLRQQPGYIVQHAAIRAYSRLRRERREAATTLALEDLLPAGIEESEGSEATILDPRDPHPDANPVEAISTAELELEIVAALTPMQRQVYDQLRSGWSRPEIGERLGLSRQAIHDHVVGIRLAALAALRERDDPAVLGQWTARAARRGPAIQ
jgi:hypothetical protein